MKLSTHLWAFVLLVGVALACSPSVEAPDGCTPPPDTAGSIEWQSEGNLGRLSLVDGRVEYGDDPDSWQMLEGTAQILSGQGIRTSEWGESLLEFGQAGYLRLFNNTKVSSVIYETGPCIPVRSRFYLEMGGVSGETTASGSEQLITTPGGVEIRVTGTSFFVAYDPVSRVTTVGKWAGNMMVSSRGSMIAMLDNFFTEIPFGQVPKPQTQLPVGLAEFEEQASQLGSALMAVSRITGKTLVQATLTVNPSVRDSAALGAIEIKLGEIISGKITQSGASVLYAFRGQPGGRILVRLVGSRPDFNPVYAVFKPDGAWLCGRDTNLPGAQGTCELDSRGLYTMLVGDSQGNQIGDYQLYLQNLVQPSGSTPLVIGQKTDARIKLGVGYHVYKLDGQLGDHLLIRIVSETGEIDPSISLYRPDGSLLCGEYTPDTILEEICQLDAGGAFTLLVGDYSGTLTGVYDLYVQSTQKPAGATPINLGEKVEASVKPAITYQVFALEAQAGESLLVRIVSEGEKIDPVFSLYRPDGTQLCGSATTGESLVELCNLDASGLYTLMVGDVGGTQTGRFGLYLQSTLHPVGATPMLLWQKTSGKIKPAVVYQAYSHEGKVGQRLLIRIVRKGEGIDPAFALYRPDGTRLCDGYSLTESLEVVCDLDASGNYTLLVSDYTGTRTGGYQLFLLPGG